LSSGRKFRVQVLDGRPGRRPGEAAGLISRAPAPTSGFQEFDCRWPASPAIIPIPSGIPAAPRTIAGINSMLRLCGAIIGVLYEQLGRDRPVDIVGHSLGGLGSPDCLRW